MTEKLLFMEAVSMLPMHPKLRIIRKPSATVLISTEWSRDDVIEAIRTYGAELSSESNKTFGELTVDDGHSKIFITTKGKT